MNRRIWRLGAAFAIAVAPAWVGCAAGVTGGGFDEDDEGGGGQGGESSGEGGSGSGGFDAAASSSTGAPSSCTEASDCGFLASSCTIGACVNGVCQRVASNEFGSCDDGLYCTEDDVCVARECAGGLPKFCPSLDSCHLGVCDEELKTCKNIAGNDGAQCEDGDACTNTGQCVAGACKKGSQIDCSIFDGACSIGACDPAVGCKPIPKNNGAACDDGKASPCSTGQCVEGACTSVAVNNGGACDDGLFCTIKEKCNNAKCEGGEPNPCAPPGGCWIASCDENFDQCSAVPGNNGLACDDGSNCTEGSVCNNGACQGGAPVNDGAACDDGSVCTTGESCSAGLCTGGTGITIYFSEDFADNAAGWTLGPEWQIGFATASVGGAHGADPAVDHSPTADNGVAGVVIGGNASQNLHSYYYLESPVIDTSVAAGQVHLGFYRWLNSDYDPFMHNSIDVYNGSQWINLWTTGQFPGIEDSPPNGAGWTFVTHNLTAYKSAQMRVRFGFDVASGGVFSIGSWNIDDVLIAEQACP
jgi:hypothetical protein